jgi:hypothetical protein
MDARYTRREALGLGLGLGAVAALSGCLGGAGSGGSTRTPATSNPDGATDDGGGSSAGAGTGTATDADADGPPVADRRLYVPYEAATLRRAVVSGGPGKDGIPSIDEPVFVDAATAGEAVRPSDIVLGVAAGGTVKAYPRRILAHHEIVNDWIGDTPVSVTYCPLTGTAQGFERGDTTFGVSGNLVNSNLVMYDRATDSRWPQMLATAISGPFEGETLREFDVVWTTWERWRAVHPETRVLSRETGYLRRYDADPYGSYSPLGGYYARNATMFSPLSTDDRLPNKREVVGVRTDAGAMAVEAGRLADEGLLDAEVGDDRIVVVYDPSLDAGYAYRPPREATVATTTDGRVRVDGGRYDPAALPFERIPAVQAMWFAWAGFFPDTAFHA